MILRVTAGQDYYEEARAAALSFWEQLNTYMVRKPEWARSKTPVTVPDDAPDVVRELTAAAAVANVGPMFSFQGAVVDHIGRFLVRMVGEVTVSSGGEYFIATKKRTKLTVVRGEGGGDVSVVIDPSYGPVGLHTTLGSEPPSDSVDGLAILAETCSLAAACAAGTGALLRQPNSLRAALDHIRSIEGVIGGVIVEGETIGVAGTVELSS